MTKNAERREKFRKRGPALTDLEKEWRAYLGQSPNPWSGAKSAGDPELEDETLNRAGPQTMQIVTHSRLSKLQVRTLAVDAPFHEA